MKIIATCMAANEFDVIEPFVRSNARFVDAIVVLDHGSVDGSADILAALAGEGLPLVVLQDRDLAFRQGLRQTQLARRYLDEMGADFCFVLDADEFVRADSRAALESALAALPEGVFGLVPMQNYFGVGADAAALNPVRRITRRMAAERAAARKVVLRREFARHGDAQVALGNHAAIHVHGEHVEPFAHRPLDGVTLAHFPVRSAEQIAKKALIGWLSHRLSDPARSPAAGDRGSPAWHWHRIFDRVASGELVLDRRLMDEAIAICAGGAQPAAVRDEDLVEDPLDAPYELRYTSAAPHRPLAVLAAWAERLVTAINASAKAG